ncbi:MAG: hypothetical protein SVV03_02160 [Candidatus Nanohaloarchaea archaeon]|nr:hypothetical protein [Candidatus Nanohaloarchaea archaeon]
MSTALFLNKGVNQDAVFKGNLVYRISTTMEKVMSLPCATKDRGVFYRSAIETGSFGCSNIFGTYIGFNLKPGSGSCFRSASSEECRYFKIKQSDSGMKVSEIQREEYMDTMSVEEKYPRLTMPISIYSRKNSKVAQGIMRVVVTK